MLDANRFAAQSAARLLPGLPALPGTRGRGATQTDFARTGPIEVAAAPSITIKPRVAGEIKSGVCVEVRFVTRYAGELGDLRELESIGKVMLEQFKAMSRGPYSAKQLAAVGHPYGRDKGQIGRRVPRGMFGRAIGSVRGVRGSVPTLSVINRQSGDLESSWSMEVERTPNGAVLRFINDSLPAYLLAAGTRRMVAHGPFSFVPASFKGRMASAWQKEIYAARQKSAAAAQIEASFGI